MCNHAFLSIKPVAWKISYAKLFIQQMELTSNINSWAVSFYSVSKGCKIKIDECTKFWQLLIFIEIRIDNS